MGTAPVIPIALPAVYRTNLELQSHVPFQHSRTRVIYEIYRVRFQGFAHARTPRVLHFSAFIVQCMLSINQASMGVGIELHFRRDKGATPSEIGFPREPRNLFT